MLSDAPPLAISAIITIALGLIVLVQGYRLARTKRYASHKRTMQLAVVLLFAFLAQYIIRFLTTGETHFSGSDFIRKFVYLPILVIHITTAIATIVMIIIHVVNSTRNEQPGPQFPKDYRAKHRKFGKNVFRMWLIAYTGGIIVFFFLYIM